MLHGERRRDQTFLASRLPGRPDAARRHLELAWAQRNGGVVLLALDWSKVFDSIKGFTFIKELHSDEAYTKQLVSSKENGRAYTRKVLNLAKAQK